MSSPGRLVLESCNSTWVFEPEKERFRRVPRGGSIAAPVPSTEWTPYAKLEVDPESDSFVVSLNAEGTRLLRSFQHSEPCPQCGEQATGEVSLQAVRDQL